MKTTLPALAVTALLVSTADASVAPVTYHYSAHSSSQVQYVHSYRRDAIIRQTVNSARAQRLARSQRILMRAKQVRHQRIMRNLRNQRVLAAERARRLQRRH